LTHEFVFKAGLSRFQFGTTRELAVLLLQISAMQTSFEEQFNVSIETVTAGRSLI
jgi:hypothetical protein